MAELSLPVSSKARASAAKVSQRICHRLALLSLLLAGCASSRAPLVECPLEPSEQQQALRAIVPVGTPRDQACRQLSEAGIEFSKDGPRSVVYCLLWNRPDGQRWHLNVALLFDREGKMYEVREANARVEAETGSSARDPRDGGVSRRASPGAAPATAAEGNAEERVPFIRRP